MNFIQNESSQQKLAAQTAKEYVPVVRGGLQHEDLIKRKGNMATSSPAVQYATLKVIILSRRKKSSLCTTEENSIRAATSAISLREAALHFSLSVIL